MYRTVKSTRCNSTPGSASLQTLAVTASPDAAAQRKKCVHVRKQHQQQPTLLFKLLEWWWWHWLFCCALLVYWPSGLYYASERICACSNCQTSPHDCYTLLLYTIYYVAQHQQNIRENAFPKVCPEKVHSRHLTGQLYYIVGQLTQVYLQKYKELLDKCKRGNKIASLRHVCLTLLVSKIALQLSNRLKK